MKRPRHFVSLEPVEVNGATYYQPCEQPSGRLIGRPTNAQMPALAEAMSLADAMGIPFLDDEDIMEIEDEEIAT